MLAIARAFVYYDDGLEGYARGSNQLLRDYIYDEANKDKLLRVNSILIDYADADTCKAIIDINFMYLNC
jgi:hypothetical protein